MQEEIQNQSEELQRFASKLRKLPSPRVNPSRMVFAGSGDSYAASLFAEQLSRGVARAWDPAELYLQVEKAKGKVAVLVSVSGRTKANVRLARRLKEVAGKTVAVTADPQSTLSSICDEVLELDYRKSERLTSGTVSFTASILACSYLLRQLPSELELSEGLKRAGIWAKSTRVPRAGALYFIGSGVNRALAEYGACKIHEVLGAKAVALFPEQLGHAELFSIDKGRDAVIGIQSGSRDPTQRVLKALKNNGFTTLAVIPRSRNTVVRSIEACFHLQHLALNIARWRGLRECAFLSDRSRLQLSNRLIY